MVRASSLLIAAFLILSPTGAEALGDMGVCYILDGILILYGVVLTVLYCRLRIHSTKPSPPPAQKQPAEGGIYAGLYSPSNDTYETIGKDKKPIV